MINYGAVKDRYGNPLKQPDERPTIEQSAYSWALVNELWNLNYCHNFQYERSDIADYIYEVSALVDKAEEIVKSNHEAPTGGIGEKITETLRKNGMNTRELADLAGISEVHLHRIINGTQEPKITVAYKIASVLHVDLGYLIGVENE